jgi:antirestriction protein
METPRLFVTTYSAYNEGKQFEHGDWVEPAFFDSYEDFCDHCEAMYAHEHQPEFMVTDFEEFPREWYSESGLPSEGVWGMLKGWAESDQQEAIEAFLAVTSNNYSDWDELEDAFNEAYAGEHTSDYNFAYDLVEQLGELDNMPEHLQHYFDYDKYARDLLMSDYSCDNGHYFRVV